ncbi:uncharacterized protein Triagg1_1984 [Trichoderma aggressivum f. europaeum]|uniref:Uncharacterized protein n=1 Tax=Trichoderma aggressivum f. europaeum TaxID=173218 RepID=A0AAE1M1U4_9HYPO|nr:hypothetical protein Triagg1_1984 [Trichoderma aggressivum f. europaeum]
MASLAGQSFSMFPQQQDEYTHFEPSHVSVYSSAPMDLSIAADAYGSYVQRATSQELYTSPSTISYEPSLYTADASYMMNGPTSPGMYGDDYLPSSGLSTASAPSAPSSAVGSPLSNHGQIGMDWTVQGLGIQPGIANGDFVEFSAFGPNGLDDMTAFEFASLAHPKSFVGKLFFLVLPIFPIITCFTPIACCLLPSAFFLLPSASAITISALPSHSISPPKTQWEKMSKVAACPGAFPLWAANSPPPCAMATPARLPLKALSGF